ncbi:tRNA synthetases class I family protein [Orientia chuto str. Dubai]|uniref:valine--tRNA ligase n=1 Tax=Orientia chuto str. Dubai TaxID=1359168 RepID=A0A0F3ML34_9RICK|nr:tRNA synthetases class I family protein [Orientia chuto str. Dubai]
MTELLPNYNFVEVEKKWQEYWQRQRIYKWNKDISKEQTFVVDTPPPTVSGLLHMGHVLSYVQSDYIVRYQRMCGKNIFFPIGFDDNGLPTERFVEKIKNVRAVDMSRTRFIEMC